MAKEKNKLKKIEEVSEDIHEDYEPDGKDLAEHLASQEQWIADNPEVKMEDVAEYHAELQSEIKRGK